MVVPQTNEAMKFLRRWREEGPWVVTAIAPTRDKIETMTFHNLQFTEMEKWINERNGKLNLYFTINPVRHDVTSKPARKDILEICAFQVDADPRIGENLELERERILKNISEFIPHPSAIIFSGGGYQCFWLLEKPIPLDGTEITAIEAEAYSVQLELLLGGDRTSNCDRVFRIPGTINLPDKIKLKKGRAPTLAQLIEWDGIRYPLSVFTKAPTKIQQLTTLGSEQLPGGGEKVKISGNVDIAYVEDLPGKGIYIKDDIKVLIVQGHDPDNPKRFPSRSEALWAVTCELVRADATDEIIAGILLNKSNGISSSVLDKPRPERYTAKQIQDAREEVESPILRELNSRHAVISDIGGKCRIISEIFDYALKRPRVSYQSFLDFMNRYLNKRVQIATDKEGQAVMKPAGKWWVEHPKRRQYETVIFAPGREIPQAYNLWQGFACEAIPGDCSLFLQHVENNLCQGNKEYFNYLQGWMARCIQKPDCPGEVAIVLRGEQGTGKGAFAKHIGSLFGRHFLQVSDPKHLVGSFNSHLRDCVLLFADEAFYAGDKKHESVLKALVTEETLAIEHKGADVFSAPNYTHIILASNSNWVVPAGSNERRFFALDVSAEKMQDKKYFAALHEQMNSGGREALLHILLNYDISEFEVRNVPKTAALQDQKLLSMGNEESWWFEKLYEGRILREHDCWEKEVMKQALQDDYVAFMHRVGILRKASPTILGKFLMRVCPEGTVRSYQRMAKVKVDNNFGQEFMVTKRVYFYELPDLEKCRNHWDSHHGGPYLWPIPLEKGEQASFEEQPAAVFR